VWGGNRTENGAAAQGILCSVLQTLAKRGLQAITWIRQLLCSPALVPSVVRYSSG
jgi:hypothetical protein